MYKLITFIIFATILVYISGCGLSDDTVAKVGSKEIKASDFTKELQKRFPGKESFADVDSAAKMQVLNNMTKQMQKLQAAYDMNLDQDPDVENEINGQLERLIYSKYYERMIVDSIIDMSKVDEYLDHIKEEVRASHILISYKGSQGAKIERSQEEAEKLANEIAAKAKTGEDFSDLALKYSDDPSAKANKGDLGYFTWGRMTDAFQQAAFGMKPGEISDPIKTEFGYHIIKVVDRRPNPQYDPNNLAASTLDIKRKLYSEKRQEASEKWKELSEKLKNEYHFAVNKDNIAQIKTITDKKRDEGKSKAEDYSNDEKDLVITQWDGGKVTLGDVFELYQRNFNQLHSRLNDPSAMEKIAENYGLQEMVVGIAKEEGIGQDEEVKEQIDEFTKNRLLALVDRKAVNEKVDVEEDEAKEYFENNKDQYKNEPEIEIWEIFVKDENLAKKLLKQAKSGEDFEKLAEKYTEDKSAKEKKGYIGYRGERRRGAVSKEAFKLGENQIGGPIKYRGGWTVFKTGMKKPETYKTFDEAKSRVMAKLKGEKTKELKEEWEKKIENKYSVKINYDLLEKI